MTLKQSLRVKVITGALFEGALIWMIRALLTLNSLWVAPGSELRPRAPDTPRPAALTPRTRLRCKSYPRTQLVTRRLQRTYPSRRTQPTRLLAHSASPPLFLYDHHHPKCRLWHVPSLAQPRETSPGQRLSRLGRPFPQVLPTPFSVRVVFPEPRRNGPVPSAT